MNLSVKAAPTNDILFLSLQTIHIDPATSQPSKLPQTKTPLFSSTKASENSPSKKIDSRLDTGRLELEPASLHADGAFDPPVQSTITLSNVLNCKAF